MFQRERRGDTERVKQREDTERVRGERERREDTERVIFFFHFFIFFLNQAKVQLCDKINRLKVFERGTRVSTLRVYPYEREMIR